MREQGEELVLRRVRADQFLAQGHVARFIFDEIKHALDGFLRSLQPQQVHVHETRHPIAIDKGMLDELIGRAERQHALDRFARCDLHLIVDRFINIAAFRQLAETFRHVSERLVCLEEMARLRIDQRDAARHVRENLFVENNFALDPPRGFGLAARHSSRDQRRHEGNHDQPQRRDADFVEQVADRFISDRSRLLDDRHPAGVIDCRERINISVALDRAVLERANFVDDFGKAWGRRAGKRREVFCKQRCPSLVDDLADRVVRDVDRGQTLSHSFDENPDAEVTGDVAFRRPHRTDDRGRHSAVGRSGMDRRDINIRRPHRAFAPERGRKILVLCLSDRRQRRDQIAIDVGHEHAVDARMRVKGLGKPLLSAGGGGRPGHDFRDVRLRLIIFDDAAGVAEIIADEVRGQLHKGLAIMQDFAFQRVAQDRVGNDQHEDGGEPARQ